jgi:DNA polymerase
MPTPPRRDPLIEALAYWRDLGVREIAVAAGPGAGAGAGSRPAGPKSRGTSEPAEGVETAETSAPAPPAAPAAPARTLPTDLEALRREVAACRLCPLAESRTQTVFCDGNPGARILFVGEAPGADEDAKGVPFVGRAGQLLTKMIEGGMGIARGDVYIANILKCRPPDNRNPLPAEVESCAPFLAAQIEAVKPEAIVALGKFAAQFLLGTEEGIMKIRGRWGEWRGIPVMPTYHPSFLLRQPERKKEVWQDLLSVLDRLGIERPPKSDRKGS